MRINIYKPNKIFRKMVWVTISIVLLSGLISSIVENLSVGVKKGDWIEYAVTNTGSPGQGQDINWARMKITNGQGTILSVSINSRYQNGSTEIFKSTLDLQTGKLIDAFIIPANLKADDTFLDQNLGNITISRVQQQIYAGAERTVLYASTNQSYYVWDQNTGVSVEGSSQQPDYSMHTIVEETNLWQPSKGLDTTLLLLIGVTLVIGIVAVGIISVILRTKKTYDNRRSKSTIVFLINT
jgi:hypothetical protein